MSLYTHTHTHIAAAKNNGKIKGVNVWVSHCVGVNEGVSKGCNENISFVAIACGKNEVF